MLATMAISQATKRQCGGDISCEIMKPNRSQGRHDVPYTLLHLSGSSRKRNMRTLFVLICSFALTCAARVDEANKNETVAQPPHHAATRSKHTPGNNAHASPATHGKHPAGGSTHVNHMQTPQHALTGRHRAGRAARRKADVTPTPSPTPTPTPFPTSDSTATVTPTPPPGD